MGFNIHALTCIRPSASFHGIPTSARHILRYLGPAAHHNSRYTSTRITGRSKVTRYFELPSTHEYEFLEGVERIDKYRPGGYHPVQLRDTLGDRNKVVHKLGYGGYSTTWLCQDYDTGEYVALKVATAYSDPREPEIISFLNYDRSNTANHPGRAMIPLIRDQFIVQGPNGIHACYSTVPALCSLSDAKDGSYKRIFRIETARSLIAQLVLAVDYIHLRGVVHGGKLFINSVMTLPDPKLQISILETSSSKCHPAFTDFPFKSSMRNTGPLMSSQ